MEKYTITNVKDESSYRCLTLRGCNRHATPEREICVMRNVPFRAGGRFDIFTDRHLHIMPIAYAYTVNGKSYVDLMHEPITDYQISHFYDKLSFWDSMRLKSAVVRAVATRGYTPMVSAANNLRLLMFNNTHKIKTL